MAPFVYLMFTHVKESFTWPNLWKCADITPIHKKGSREDVENYRPISILPRISLIFERFLFNCIYSKLELALNPLQHGFRSKHSTVTQLIVFLHKLHLNFDKNLEQVVVYLDFSKAFDSVDHSNLLKLARFGFDKSFVSLLCSYLSDRRQRVNIDGFLSDKLPVASGVPQGSVLGPLLFLIYIDDMIRVPQYSQVYCFADDNKLLCCGDSVFGNVQKDLNALRLWSHCNGLSFNSSKCYYLHSTPSTSYSVSIGVDDIERVPCVTDLGIVILSSLKWKHHIQTKLLKERRSFGYLKHSVPYNIPSGVKYNLFKACVLSLLLYGYPAWHPEMTELRKLELLN